MHNIQAVLLGAPGHCWQCATAACRSAAAGQGTGCVGSSNSAAASVQRRPQAERKQKTVVKVGERAHESYVVACIPAGPGRLVAPGHSSAGTVGLENSAAAGDEGGPPGWTLAGGRVARGRAGACARARGVGGGIGSHWAAAPCAGVRRLGSWLALPRGACARAPAMETSTFEEDECPC